MKFIPADRHEQEETRKDDVSVLQSMIKGSYSSIRGMTYQLTSAFDLQAC